MPCPGCHRVTLNVNQKNGWHASHIRAKVNGGSTQAYNLYPLCDNCNGEMGDTNMFCHFYKDNGERSHTLDALISAMHQVFRIEYASKYQALDGQFHALAQHYYTDIPVMHPIYTYFIEYDIRINTNTVMEAKNEYDRLYNIAQSVNSKYKQRKTYTVYDRTPASGLVSGGPRGSAVYEENYTAGSQLAPAGASHDDSHSRK
jgi:hypothetical protein